MNVKNHRLRVSSQTRDKRKFGVAFLHSRLFTLGGFTKAYRTYFCSDA